MQTDKAALTTLEEEDAKGDGISRLVQQVGDAEDKPEHARAVGTLQQA